MTRTDTQNQEGEPFPLGLTWVAGEEVWNFALYSKHAERVTLLLYGDKSLTQPLVCRELDYRVNKSGPIWHCAVPRAEAAGARFYAYRVHGPAAGPGFAWHAFDGEKLLVDPYARSLYFPPGFDREAARQPGSNEGHAPLALLQAHQCAFAWEDDHPMRHGSDLIIYEMHVRGFTRNANSGVNDAERGTFSGVVRKIPYLCELGVTAIELMPVFQFDPQDGNYWGYMPLNFFAPHHGYASAPPACDQHNEFRAMVKALHAAGMEVILDVVYNHTCEGDERGPTYSFKGIDNTTYYLLSGNPASPYQNYSGTGNTLHTANRAVRQLIVDSLRYWVKEMHVDGFRFDLASVFTRSESGSVSPTDPPIFGQISADPDLADIRLIAEPWDAGGAYQLGRTFPGQLWMQWNARYRDTLQRFVRGDAGLVPDLMTRLHGSTDLFPDDRMNACRPWQSVNYITSHDGFTLYDLNNATTWLDWRRLDEHRDIFRFFQRMIAFRKSHPSLGRQHFWSADISWYNEELAVDMSCEARTLAYCLHGSSAADRDMYVMINASPRDPRFGIHEGAAGQWKRIIDTSLASPNDITDPGQEPIVESTFYHVQPHSVVVLLR